MTPHQTTPTNRRTRRRFPPWLRKRIPAGGDAERVVTLLRGLQLETVCQNAHCPNMAECFARGTATFMIMGNVCTRNCGFCAVTHGSPKPLDQDEPERVAQAAAHLRLRHVVITSVTRDDLPDHGSGHFRDTVLALRRGHECRIEILTPDFGGHAEWIDRAAGADPTVYNHNVETVPRLYSAVRPQANYRRSLRLLARVKERFPHITTKSGMMVGLGETTEGVIQAMRDLRRAGCDMLTIGQYLAPSANHLPIARFVTPQEFHEYEREGAAMGFAAVAAGPFVRSSYNAEKVFEKTQETQNASLDPATGSAGPLFHRGSEDDH